MRAHIGSDRLIALTDGVVAVVITIMVLELKPPPGAGVADLVRLWPTLLSFALSFVYVAIYWNNHHHFFRLVPHVTGGIMWANLNLLFWLSLIPFATAWMDEHAAAPIPVATYGACLLLCALSWYLMQTVVVHAQGTGSPLKPALGRDLKGTASPILYLIAIAAALYDPRIAYAIYAGVAAWWLVPDRRVEAALKREEDGGRGKD